MMAKYFIKVGGYYKSDHSYFRVLDIVEDKGRSGVFTIVVESFYLHGRHASLYTGELIMNPKEDVELFSAEKFHRIYKMLWMFLNTANIIVGDADNNNK